MSGRKKEGFVYQFIMWYSEKPNPTPNWKLIGKMLRFIPLGLSGKFQIDSYRAPERDLLTIKKGESQNERRVSCGKNSM